MKTEKHAFGELGPFVSFVDLTLGDTNTYLNSGFVKDSLVSIDYFYYDKKTKSRVSKQKRRKKAVNTPKDMTEYEHAKLDGLVRIWDCGKVKYRYNGPGRI